MGGLQFETQWSGYKPHGERQLDKEGGKDVWGMDHCRQREWLGGALRQACVGVSKAVLKVGVLKARRPQWLQQGGRGCEAGLQ